LEFLDQMLTISVNLQGYHQTSDFFFSPSSILLLTKALENCITTAKCKYYSSWNALTEGMQSLPYAK